MNKKKRETAEDFIGWKSEDGLLEVVVISGRQWTGATYKVICHKCIKDKELFPLGYFVCLRGDLIRGSRPCGCSKKPKWNKEQFLVLARSAAKDRFIVHGFAEEFHGAKTKLDLECLKDKHKWTASVTNIINNCNGCPKCKVAAKRTDKQDALDKCKAICEIEGYKPVDFPDGYKNAFSIFEYFCPKHKKQKSSYNNFVNQGKRCKSCYKERQRESGSLYGYYPERKDEKAFLYVLDFDSKYLKVGRSFDVDYRIGNLNSRSKIKKIYKLRIFTATHQEIYDLEQELHNELRERNFQYYVDWSSECFENECLFILNKLLDNCGLEEYNSSINSKIAEE